MWHVRREEVAVSDWEPATEAETAMRDALRAGDQELYFRILAGEELLLPVSADALAGRAFPGWGTWTTDGRTHVLAFTSVEALHACLAEHTGSARRIAYQELAANWPNLDWWLAINPGLPIEGYLPAWFVSQLARGDVRLPGRTFAARARIERTTPTPRARATAAVPVRSALPQLRADHEAGREHRALPQRPNDAAATAAATLAVAAAPVPAVPAAPAASAVPAAPVPTVAATSATSAPPTVSAAPAAAGPAALAAPTAPAVSSVSGSGGPGVRSVSPGTNGSPIGSAPAQAREFTPANDVEASLLDAAEAGSTDSFLSTLLLAKVLLPTSPGSAAGVGPGEEGFTWRTETIDGETYVVVFTSRSRLAEHLAEPVDAVSVKFVQLIRAWPGGSWSFAVNPGSPVGAKLPGSEIVALASWAAEVGLGHDAGDPGSDEWPVEAAPAESRSVPVREPVKPTMMQKAIAPSQVSYYLERGYDRVAGFVHRAHELDHLRTPAALRAALGLRHAGSPFAADADEVYVLRWPAYQPSLYRIPYGGQTETAMRAMEGWVIERPPFRGNGFAPGESGDVIAEFKVDSVRLPHGAQLWRLTTDGREVLVARFDADGPLWRRVGED
jgi:hypothetical protein